MPFVSQQAGRHYYDAPLAHAAEEGGTAWKCFEQDRSVAAAEDMKEKFARGGPLLDRDGSLRSAGGILDESVLLHCTTDEEAVPGKRLSQGKKRASAPFVTRKLRGEAPLAFS